MMISTIKQNFEKCLESDLSLALGNLDDLGKITPKIDTFKLTASSYRFITHLMQIYSELIVEMTASIYQYSIATFFVLDAKFFIWKGWLETLSALYRFYITDSTINGSLPSIVLHLTDKARDLYETFLLKKEHLYDQKIIIEKFLEIDSETYQTFRQRIKQIIKNPIVSDLDTFNQLEKLSFEVTLWMQYATFVALSLDRCLYGDKKILISGISITVYKETKLNIVNQFIKAGITDFNIQFTNSELQKYGYLFTEVRKHEIA